MLLLFSIQHPSRGLFMVVVGPLEALVDVVMDVHEMNICVLFQ